ncbi:DUF11 domain-containing protein, partial [Pseudolactococcus reticulitermitis]|uniref:DUF11 domain-containing protein n=1 Tax=Pseudolactococcus reticulitermitis TaxID=2025039 RepID=UPI001056C71C
MKNVAKSYFMLIILLLQVILPFGQVNAVAVNQELVYFTQYKTEKKIEEVEIQNETLEFSVASLQQEGKTVLYLPDGLAMEENVPEGVIIQGGECSIDWQSIKNEGESDKKRVDFKFSVKHLKQGSITSDTGASLNLISREAQTKETSSETDQSKAQEIEKEAQEVQLKEEKPSATPIPKIVQKVGTPIPYIPNGFYSVNFSEIPADDAHKLTYLEGYEIDANDATTQVYRSTLTVGGQPLYGWLNALSVYDDGFFATLVQVVNGAKVQHFVFIDWNGEATILQNDLPVIDILAGTIDVKENQYIVLRGTVFEFYTINPDHSLTLDHSIPLQVATNPDNLADIVIDDAGYLWAFNGEDQKLYRADKNTGVITAAETISKSNGDDWTFSSGALAFLPDGRLINKGYKPGGTYTDPGIQTIIDLKTGVGTIRTKDKQSFIGQEDQAQGDYASLVIPKNISPELTIEKSAPPKVENNDTFTYQFKVKNIGTIPTLDTRVKDVLPENLEYVPNTTKVNGSLVSDVAGESPLFSSTGLSIHSIDSQIPGEVMHTEDDESNAVQITVEVRAVVPKNFPWESDTIMTTIPNTATVGAANVNTVTSNEVKTIVPGYKGKAEAEKHVFDSTGKKIDGESVKVGDVLTYELTVKNIGDAKSELVDYEFGDDVED